MPTPHREDKLIGDQMMNYEVNPFQDYESITVDELKDQANSLLNLVTEEQRPLRVCMNNGKEFLLFPQDLLAPICDSDFRLILLSAMRYAMGTMQLTEQQIQLADVDGNPGVSVSDALTIMRMAIGVI